jgi:hypothetical protein
MLNGLPVAESLRVDTGFCAESLTVTWVAPWEVPSGRREWTGQTVSGLGPAPAVATGVTPPG